MKNRYQHRVLSEVDLIEEQMAERAVWCHNTFGSYIDGGWCETESKCIYYTNGEVAVDIEPEYAQCFHFEKEEDAVLFKLTWGGYYSLSQTHFKL